MAFQQAGCCDEPASSAAAPSRVVPGHYHRVLRYWTQRAAIAAALPPPTGLYDSAVWERFHLEFEMAVSDGLALATEEEE